MSNTLNKQENAALIEERIKNYLRREFPFLNEEEIQESWEKYYRTQSNISPDQGSLSERNDTQENTEKTAP